MILSDTEIKELCQIPNVEITDKVWHQPRPGHSVSDGTITKRLAYCDGPALDRLKKEVDKLKCITGPSSFRVLTEDEQSLLSPMIYPFISEQVRTQIGSSGNMEKILSFGLSSAGYDVRLSDKFKVFTNINSVCIDPLNFDEACLHDHEGSFCIIPPNSYILGVTVETFNIPDDVMVVCVGKSTMARSGAIVNVTPIEPGFKGKVVIEIANSTSLPLKVYANMGISQFLFFKMKQPAAVPYSAGNRKYQNQDSLTLAKA
jgi:dCTP deaminase